MFNQNAQHQCQSKTKSKAKAKAKAKSKSRAKALAVAYVQAQEQANTKAIVKVKGHNSMAHSPNSRLNYGKDSTILTNSPTSACPNSDYSLASTIALNSLNASTGTSASASAITCALSSAHASAGTYASASSCARSSAISRACDSDSSHCCAAKEATDPIALSEPFKQNSSFLRYLMELLEDDKGSLCLTQSLDHHGADKTKAYHKALFNSTIEPSLEHSLEKPTATYQLDYQFAGENMTNVNAHPFKHYLLFALSILTCIFVMFQSIRSVMADDALDDLIAVSGSNYQLSAEDKKVLDALSKANSHKGAKGKVSRAQVSDATSVRFVYGASRPNLVCSLLHVCDIALEPNETVVDLKVGDSTRWIIERTASGSAQGMIEHIIVKPTDIGLQSNLRIYTDKRTYYLDLSSSDKEFMPQISFIYPEQALQNFAQIKSDLMNKLKTRTIATNSDQDPVLIDNLDFSYRYSGDESLYPIRTFNDGKKTYLQMPPKLMNSTLPALVVVNGTHLFSEDDIAVTNYRIKDNKFIIDGLPEHIRLMSGNQDNGVAKSADIIHQS